jgi:hypothetical protein
MSLLDRLRGQPAWQHADPSVRVSAVDEIDSDAQDLLAAIAAEDVDPSVRLTALSRLVDPDAIRRIAEVDTDESVRVEAFSMLREIAVDETEPEAAVAALAGLVDSRDLGEVARTARLESISRAALDRVETQKAIGAVARRSNHQTVREAALSRLDEQGEVVAVAVKSDHRDIALAAFARLSSKAMEDRDLLKVIGVRARTKQVARRARAALAELEARPSSVESRQAREDLCEGVEALAGLTNQDTVNRRLREAEQQWRQLQDATRALATSVSTESSTAAEGEDEAVSARWDRAVAAARDHLTGLQQVTTEADRARGEALAGRTAMCERLSAVIDDPAADQEKLATEVARLRAEWNALPELSPTEASSKEGSPSGVERRFEDLIRAAGRKVARQRTEAERGARLTALVETLENVGGSAETKVLTTQWNDPYAEWQALVRAGEELAPELVQRVEAAETKRSLRLTAAREERQRREQANLVKQQGRCESIERAVADESLELKTAEHNLRLTRSMIGNLGRLPTSEDREALTQRLRDAQTALMGKTRELRGLVEWKQWANVGIQAALCQRLEALAARDDDADLLKKFRQVMAEWRKASDVPRGEGEAIWQRFKAAHDAILPRIEASEAVEDAQRGENLEKKVALCEEAESLTESTDWIKTAARITELQEAWKKIGPATRKQEREVWNRFRGACGKFFKRRRDDLAERKKIWAKNAELKEALCQQAEALVDEKDHDVAKAATRRLQAEWKTVGPVRRTRSEALWQRFRAACDQVYVRAQEAADAVFADQVAARAAVCERLEALVMDPPRSPEPGKDGRGSDGEDPGSDDSTADEVSLAEGGVEVGPSEDRPEAPGDEKSADEAPADASTEAVPLPAPGEDVAPIVASARAEWKQFPSIPRALERDLTERFDAALVRLVEQHPDAFAGTDLDPRRNQLALEQLCERVEALLAAPEAEPADNRLPSEILASRLREALASNTMGAKVDPEVERREKVDAVKGMQAEQRALGVVPGDVGRKLAERFRGACDRVFQRYPAPSSTRPPRARRDGRGRRPSRS